MTPPLGLQPQVAASRAKASRLGPDALPSHANPTPPLYPAPRLAEVEALFDTFREQTCDFLVEHGYVWGDAGFGMPSLDSLPSLVAMVKARIGHASPWAAILCGEGPVAASPHESLLHPSNRSGGVHHRVFKHALGVEEPCVPNPAHSPTPLHPTPPRRASSHRVAHLVSPRAAGRSISVRGTCSTASILCMACPR